MKKEVVVLGRSLVVSIEHCKEGTIIRDTHGEIIEAFFESVATGLGFEPGPLDALISQLWARIEVPIGDDKIDDKKKMIKGFLGKNHDLKVTWGIMETIIIK